jgi:beta-lactamase class A
VSAPTLCLLALFSLSACRLQGRAAETGSQPLRAARTGHPLAVAPRPVLAAAVPRPPGPQTTAPFRNDAGAKNQAERDAPAPGTSAPVFTPSGNLAQRLKAVVEDAVDRGVARRVGVAVYDLATGEAVGLNASSPFRPASVIKLAVLVAAYRARSAMTPAEFKRLRPDLQRMITVSDNAATRRLIARLGARKVNEAIQVLGIRQFRVGESGSREWVLQGSKAAPADTALLLAKIARRQVVSREASDEMLALLGAQQKRGRIPAGLPALPDLWVGNKTGTLNGVVNDAGIVLQPPRGIGYTLAIFTSGTRSEAAGEQLLSDLSAAVYGYMAARGKHG